MAAGTGGNTPPPAGYADPPLPGVAPGSAAGIFRGRQVVIASGTAGAGLFVYNGRPGPGNPPVASIVAPGTTTDPYGNTVAAILELGAQGGGNPFTVFDQFGNIKLFSSSGSAIIQQSPANEAMFIYQELFGPQGPLLISLAGKAGTDPNTGTAYPAGLLATAGTIQGVQIIGAGTTGIYLGYSAATPAAGNLVFSVSPVAGTDSFGNAYLAGVSSYSGSGGFWLATSVQGGLTAMYTATSSAGPWSQIAEVGAIQNDGEVHFQATGGSHLVADTIWYKLSNSGVGREIWQDMRPLSNSFVGTINNRYPPQYRLAPDGNVEIAGFVQFPSAGGPNFNSITFATLPAAYRPANNSGPKWPVTFETNVAPVGTPCVQIDTAGNMQFHNCPASGMANNVASIYGRYPLGATQLIVS